ncbi:MFS transporter [Sulfurirhabdus autotrophica]|uniref:Putative MFS family arabinose efflux permease n=1 Tax=Sulfurirhabdus autotrophica TaxID=1706046 RepID=A0A4V2W302_9PROT|nr:MFS transporter [Sulfurirhabdus autotrophica]TCV90049.1 putative MFS family arabinose efflux permease [Sulfurirhabdus autotrophica]
MNVPTRNSILSGPWAPLNHSVFRMLWIASIVSNIGSWMHEVGAGWLMTSLASSPLMVALVQAATTAPVFLLALPSGALADIVDRRRYLITSQVWMMVIAGTLGALTLWGVTTAPILLIFTFALGIGTAMMMPAWGAMTPELVERSELHAAIGLNTIGMNVSRSVGPALAGLIVATAGPGMVFILNAISFLAVIAALKKWQRPPNLSDLPAERVIGAIRSGLRYARHSPDLQAVLIRGAGFFIFASASWALLPLIVRQELNSGPGTYGLFLASLGVGAIAGALVLPHIHARISRDKIVAGATGLYTIAMLALAHSVNVYTAGAAMVIIGVAWISVVSSLMTSAQTALPSWVRARGLALFWVVFMGGMAMGSALWGQVATLVGIPDALTAAAIGAVFSIAATWRFQIGQHDVADLSPSMSWPTLMLADGIECDRGPVMVTVEYQIDPEKVRGFIKFMNQMRRIRRRDGAFMWDLFKDIEYKDRMVECFMVESWLEHLRQHERFTVADRDVIEKVRAFHLGSGLPKVTHLVAMRKSLSMK